MLTLGWVQKKIKELRIRPSRDNGQNFLINEQALEEIISAGDVAAGDQVLEIGPGLGALTEALLAVGAHVTAVELDEKLATHLRATILDTKNFNLISGNALKICDDNFLAGLGKYKLIANIPYNITSDIIRHFIEARHAPTVAALLIQKEVAERIIAQPPRMNMLALFTQWFAGAHYTATIPRAHFYPAPVVDSAIIRLEPKAGLRHKYNLEKSEQEKLFSLIKRGFAHPRKQLGNNLGGVEGRGGFNFTRRAETLNHEEWLELLHTLS